MYTITLHNVLIWCREQLKVPVPPNPVRAKKMAAARAAREAKRSSTLAQLQLQQQLEAEEARRVREERRSEARRQVSAAAVDGELQESLLTRAPTRWYMGQYGNNDGSHISAPYIFHTV